MAPSSVSYGTMMDIVSLGATMIFRVISVMMPSVPSDPMSRCKRLYPELVFETVAPSFTISPVGRTTVMPLT